MSGGIYDYLCFTGMPEILERTGDMEKIEERLSQLGEIDIAQDIHELVICCNKARDQIPEMFDRLQDVFYAVEWYDSGDWNAEELKKELDKYKIEKEKREWDVIVKIIKQQSMKAKRTLRSYESCSSSV